MSHERITRDPKIMQGKPCIAGTRVPIDVILEDLSDGMSIHDVTQSYEGVTEEDVRAALEYAAEYLRQESVIAAE